MDYKVKDINVSQHCKPAQPPVYVHISPIPQAMDAWDQYLKNFRMSPESPDLDVIEMMRQVVHITAINAYSPTPERLAHSQKIFVIAKSTIHQSLESAMKELRENIREGTGALNSLIECKLFHDHNGAPFKDVLDRDFFHNSLAAAVFGHRDGSDDDESYDPMALREKQLLGYTIDDDPSDFQKAEQHGIECLQRWWTKELLEAKEEKMNKLLDNGNQRVQSLADLSKEDKILGYRRVPIITDSTSRGLKIIMSADIDMMRAIYEVRAALKEYWQGAPCRIINDERETWNKLRKGEFRKLVRIK